MPWADLFLTTLERPRVNSLTMNSTKEACGLAYLLNYMSPLVSTSLDLGHEQGLGLN